MTLNYKSFGAGPALIILHGLFGSLDNWVSLAKRFSTEFSVFLIDQRNHGRSPHDPIWDYPTMAEDLAEFMDQHGIMIAHLLGHSMGGKTVMQFANEYPERIEKLIVADMAPKAYEPHHTEILNALIHFDLSKVEDRKDAEAKLRTGIADHVVRQFLLKSLGRDQEKNFRWKFNLPVIYQHYHRILEEISLDFPFEKPTLFLSGAESIYINEGDRESILEVFNAARFQVIPNAGHWLHADQPLAFQQAVLDFLLS